MKPTEATVKMTLDPDAVNDILVNYKPRVVTDEEWAKLRAFVLNSLQRLEYGSKSVLQDEMLLLTRFSAWCCSHGLALDHETILTPSLMEAFAADPGTPKVTPSQRWSFTRWGRALTRDAPWTPARKSRTGTSPSLFSPYTDHEVDVMWDLAGRQNTELRRRTATVLIGLCEGAGMSPDEAKWATPEDLHRSCGELWITVGDPFPRDVPIRRRYGDALGALAKATEPGAVLSGRDPRTHRACDLTAAILQKTDLHQAPRLSGRRLRHSWIRRMLDNDVPIRDLYNAAGSLDAKTLLDALRTLTPSDPDKYLRNLLPS